MATAIPDAKTSIKRIVVQRRDQHEEKGLTPGQYYDYDELMAEE